MSYVRIADIWNNMKAPERFQTARLVGRRPRLEDSERIFSAYAQDAKVTKYLTWKPHRDSASLRRWIISLIERFGGGNQHEYVLALKEEEAEPVGMISMRVDGHMVAFGYVIRRSMWGRGYAAEALTHLVDWALAQEGIFRAWAVGDVDNAASARVMEKSGLQREGILRSWALHPNVSPDPRDVFSYAKIRTGSPEGRGAG